jgi:hypothetical protein
MIIGKKYYYDNDKVHQIVVLGTLKDIQPTKRNGRNVYHFENDGILRNFEVEISEAELENIHEMTTDLKDVEPIKKCMLELNQITTASPVSRDVDNLPPKTSIATRVYNSVTSPIASMATSAKNILYPTPEKKIAKIVEEQEKKKKEIITLEEKKKELEQKISENQTKIKNEKTILSKANEMLNNIKEKIRIKSEHFKESVKLKLLLDTGKEKSKKILADRLAKKNSNGGFIGGDNEQLQQQEEIEQLQQKEKNVQELERKISALETVKIELLQQEEKTEEEIKKKKGEIEYLEKEKAVQDVKADGGNRRMKRKLTKKKRHGYTSKIRERSSKICNQNKKTRRFLRKK